MSPDDLPALNQTFALPGQLSFQQHPSGLVCAEIANTHARAIIFLHGAHLAEWTPHGQAPVVWLSPAAQFAVGKALRGGVPVCWPWFGARPGLPAHGYARTSHWQVAASAALAGGSTRLVLRLPPNPALWPHDTAAEIRFTVGRSLAIELLTRNHGAETAALSQALHTYFKVADVRQIAIHGLDGCPYLDKLDGQRKRQAGPVGVAGEVDRVYLEVGGTCWISDPGLSRRIRIAAEGSASAIVWNPWAEKSRQLGDMGGEEAYLGMVCVETANAEDDQVKLAPGAEHRLAAVYALEALA